MALIAMAIHDTEENGRSYLTNQTLNNLFNTVRRDKHRIFLIDNGSCVKTKEILYNFGRYPGVEVITLPENIGTANAINLGWKQRRPGEHCVKMDNDVVIDCDDWVERLEEAIEREPLIGQIGLKRNDCWETTTHENKELRSTLIQLPHVAGQRWIVVERAKHIMGTCVLHSSALLDKIGYLYQPTKYGHDDVLASWRSHLAGFINVFLPHIDIHHIDPGGTEYQKWKEAEGAKNGHLVSGIVDEYISGVRSIYYNPYD